jgi:hypothetical protein
LHEDIVKYEINRFDDLPRNGDHMRTDESEKWRQMGAQTWVDILAKLMKGMSQRPVLVVMLQALPTDIMHAVCLLNKATSLK